MITLDDPQVHERLPWNAVLAALEEAFRDPAAYRSADRVALAGPDGSAFLTMPCCHADGSFGVKQVAVVPTNAARGLPTVQAHYTLFDATGTPALSAAATTLTKLRTAAVSALAASRLAPERARVLLVVGTGSLAPWMAEAHAQVRAFDRVLVWGRRAAAAERTAADIERRLAHAPARPDARPSLRAVDDLDAALAEADVVTVATTAREPVVLGDALHPGMHLDFVGAFDHTMCEFDTRAALRARVFVDDRAAARAEAGDLHAAAASGWTWNDVRGDLHDLAVNRAGRADPSDITLFKSVGLALEDLAVARLLLEGVHE